MSSSHLSNVEAHSTISFDINHINIVLYYSNSLFATKN